jgi:hypothetical protein
MKHYCENHPLVVAFYMARNRFFCEECRPQACQLSAKESVSMREPKQSFEFRAPRIRRRDAGIHSVL